MLRRVLHEDGNQVHYYMCDVLFTASGQGWTLTKRTVHSTIKIFLVVGFMVNRFMLVLSQMREILYTVFSFV